MSRHKIIWENTKIYDHQTIVKRIEFIKSNMYGLLPLCNNKNNYLVNYANKNNIPPYEMISLQNTMRIQREIICSKKFHLSTEEIKMRFITLLSELANDPINHKKKINKWLRSIKMPISSVIKIVTKMPEFRLLSVKDVDVIKRIDNCITMTNMEIFNRSVEFEHLLENYLKSLGIKFRTESDIKRDKDYTVTPDILFDDPIILELDGRKYTIKWMDAKNYILIGAPFIMKSLRKQSEKYNNIFGFGAFVFHYGFDKSINIPNVLILDGSELKSK